MPPSHNNPGPGPHTAPPKVGFWTCFALVVGNMVGAGVYLLPSSLAAIGPISVLGWVLTGLGGMSLAYVFAGLARARPAEGGPYAYTRMGLGDFTGFLVAWGYWISVWVGNAAISIAFVGYLTPLLPGAFGTQTATAVLAISAIWILTAVNLRGIQAAGRLQIVTTALKVIPLIAVGTLGLLYIDLGNLTPVNPSGRPAVSAVTASAALALWALLGLETATVPADNVADPQRTIPKATMLGTGFAAVFYLLSTVAIMGVIPSATLAESSAPYADAAAAMWGSTARMLVSVGAAIAGFGVLNGWILISAQIPYAAARDGLFPARFLAMSKRGVPVFGLLLSSVLTTALVATNFTRGLVGLFTFSVLLATLTALIPYAFTALAQLVLFARNPE
ncbi:MAG: amino acid permease, partial [Longimicrobiales bacterium]